jgi:hypothetical protein
MKILAQNRRVSRARGRAAEIALLLACSGVFSASRLAAESVTVRYAQGAIHAFAVLRTLDGAAIADGELTQVARADRVTDDTTLRFKDGSFYRETVVFSQRGFFRLLSDHVIQRGTAFKQAMETSLDASTGEFTARYTDGGTEKTLREHINVPLDLANGMIPVLLQNLRPGPAQWTVSMVVATPKPRIVKLVISPEGEEPFTIGSSNHKATRYLIKMDIGGAAGVLAPLLGKQPPDMHMWIVAGDVPVFIKSEAPLYAGGPIWRIELASPAWPPAASQSPAK